MRINTNRVRPNNEDVGTIYEFRRATEQHLSSNTNSGAATIKEEALLSSIREVAAYFLKFVLVPLGKIDPDADWTTLFQGEDPSQSIWHRSAEELRSAPWLGDQQYLEIAIKACYDAGLLEFLVDTPEGLTRPPGLTNQPSRLEGSNVHAHEPLHIRTCKTVILALARFPKDEPLSDDSSKAWRFARRDAKQKGPD